MLSRVRRFKVEQALVGGSNACFPNLLAPGCSAIARVFAIGCLRKGGHLALLAPDLCSRLSGGLHKTGILSAKYRSSYCRFRTRGIETEPFVSATPLGRVDGFDEDEA